MSTLPLIVQLMHYIIDCTVLHNRRLLYPRQSQSRSQLFVYIRVQHMLSRSCHQDATLMSACTGTVYPIWIISVCFISRPMLEVRDDRPRRRHLSPIFFFAIVPPRPGTGGRRLSVHIPNCTKISAYARWRCPPSRGAQHE